MKSLKPLFLVLCLSLSCVSAYAQAGSVTVNGSNLQDSSGNKVSNATICFAPTNATGKAISFRVNGNGQAVFTPVCTQVTAGAWTLTIADTNLTFPQNVCFNVTATDNTSGNSLLGPGYGCVQPAYNTSAPNNWCASGTCNFDDYLPAATSLQVSAAPAITGVNVTTGTPGGQASGSVSGPAPNYQLNLTIPQGPAGPAGQGYRERGSWNPSTAYAAYDIFSYSGTAYAVNTPYISGSSFGSSDTANTSVFASGTPGTDTDAVHKSSTIPQSLAAPLGEPALNPSAVIVYGDSNTAYSSGTTCYYQGQSTCWPNRIAALLGVSLSSVTNRAVSGDQAADLAAHAFNYDSPTLAAPQPWRGVMIGTNDANAKGAGAYEVTFNSTDQAALSWLAVPASFKVLASAGTGTCTSDATYAAATGEMCTASGSTISLSLTTYGGPIYIWPRFIDGDTGTWTYQVDSGSPVSVSTAFATAIGTQNSLTTAPGLIRVTGVTAGTHTILFTQTASGTMAIVGVGTPPSGGLSTGYPYVVVGNVFNQLNGNDQSAVNAYRTDVSNNISLLQGDGLQLYYAPTEKFVQMTTGAGDSYNTLHANANGGAEIAEAFLFPARMMAGVPSSGFTWPATVTNMDGNASTHGATQLSSNTFAPGLNVYENTGNSIGWALAKTSAGTYYVDSFMATGIGGWRYCVYPSSTPLATPSQETYCTTMPVPTANGYVVTSTTQLTSLTGQPAIVPQGVSNVDGSLNVGWNAPSSGVIGQGLNLYHAAGNSAGMALSHPSGFTLDNYQPSGWSGWRFCGYTAGTPLTSTSSETCSSLPYPSANTYILTGPSSITSGQTLIFNGTAGGVSGVAGATKTCTTYPTVQNGVVTSC